MRIYLLMFFCLTFKILPGQAPAEGATVHEFEYVSTVKTPEVELIKFDEPFSLVKVSEDTEAELLGYAHRVCSKISQDNGLGGVGSSITDIQNFVNEHQLILEYGFRYGSFFTFRLVGGGENEYSNVFWYEDGNTGLQLEEFESELNWCTENIPLVVIELAHFIGPERDYPTALDKIIDECWGKGESKLGLDITCFKLKLEGLTSANREKLISEYLIYNKE